MCHRHQLTFRPGICESAVAKGYAGGIHDRLLVHDQRADFARESPIEYMTNARQRTEQPNCATMFTTRAQQRCRVRPRVTGSQFQRGDPLAVGVVLDNLVADCVDDKAIAVVIKGYLEDWALVGGNVLPLGFEVGPVTGPRLSRTAQVVGSRGLESTRLRQRLGSNRCREDQGKQRAVTG